MREIERGEPISVAETGPLLHAISRRIFEDYEAATTDEYGLLQSRRKSALPFRVSPMLKDRALRVLDAVLLAFESRGMEIQTNDGLAVSTEFAIVCIQICEGLTREEREPTKAEREMQRARLRWPSLDESRAPRPEPKYYRQVAGGTLSLSIVSDKQLGVRKGWSDTERLTLDSQLNSFVVGVIRFGEAVHADQERRRLQQLRWEEEARQRREEEARRFLEQRRQDDLWKLLDRWDKAARIREFAKAASRQSPELASTLARDQSLEEWVRWMYDLADRIDPLNQFPPATA